jgi:hypothetical protein
VPIRGDGRLRGRRRGLTREQQLLLRACLLPDERAVEAWRQWCSIADLDHLGGSCQRLVPLLHRNLEALGVRDPVLRRYRGIRRYHWSKNHVVLGRVSRLTRALEERALPYVVLHDLALMLSHDADPGDRPLSRLGILVRPEHVSRAVDGLGLAGYRGRHSFERGALASTGALAMTGERGSPSIDLYRHLFPGHLDSRADAPFWSRAEEATIGRISTRPLVMDPTDLLLHVLVHGAACDRIAPIRWIPDAATILRGSDVAWARMAGDAERLGFSAQVAAALRELGTFVELELPVGMFDRAERGAVQRARRIANDWGLANVGVIPRRLRMLAGRSPRGSLEEPG